MEKSKKVSYIAFGISILGSFIFMTYMYIDTEKQGFTLWLMDSNLKIYGSFLILFFGSFMFLSRLGKFICRREGKAILLSKASQIVLDIIIVSVGFGLFTHWGLVAQFEEEGVVNGTYYDFPIVFHAVLMLVFFVWMAWMIIKDKDIESISLWVTYVISFIVTFMCLFIVNPFSCTNSSLDFSMGIWDNTSVTETIYNVYDEIPYTYSTTGLYGHYGLFFLLPLKILGGG